MKPLSRLESLIADILERPAWTLSARTLHPLELTAALTKAMEARGVRLVDRVLAPDAYEVSVNPADLAAFGDAVPVLEHELAEYLRRTITERDLSANRPPRVRLLSSESVRRGGVAVTARFSPRDEADTAVPSPRRTEVAAGPMLAGGGTVTKTPTTPRRISEAERGAGAALEVLDGDGQPVQSFPLTLTSTTIGRRSDVEVSLLDSKVSREHARIERSAGGYAVTDLQSLNGTFVNGEQVNGARPLHAGDVLEIGRYRLRFRDGSG